MKKLACSCAAAALLAGASPTALAANSLEGSYIGAGGGRAQAKFVHDDFASSVPGVTESQIDTTNKSYKIYFATRLDKHWGLEAAHTSFGNFSHRYETSPTDFLVQDYKVSGWSLSLLPTIPIGRFSLFGRIGMFRSSVKSVAGASSGTVVPTLAAAGVPAGGSNTKGEMTTILGAGMQLDLPGQLGMRLEYEDYGSVGDQDNTGRARPRLASFSLYYRF